MFPCFLLGLGSRFVSETSSAEIKIGRVPLSEPSVIVAASAPHRGEAFAGARALIDRVKAEAPIWKVELTAEGARRVEGTLPA